MNFSAEPDVNSWRVEIKHLYCEKPIHDLVRTNKSGLFPFFKSGPNYFHNTLIITLREGMWDAIQVSGTQAGLI